MKYEQALEIAKKKDMTREERRNYTLQRLAENILKANPLLARLKEGQLMVKA